MDFATSLLYTIGGKVISYELKTTVVHSSTTSIVIKSGIIALEHIPGAVFPLEHNVTLN